MTSPFAGNIELSRRTSKLIDWVEIRKNAVGFRQLGSGESAPSPPSATSEQVSKVFAAAKGEFAKALESTNRLTYLLMTGIGAAVIAAAAGVLVAAVYNHLVEGAALSVAGVVSLIGLVNELLKVGRDQAFLNFFLSGYEIAFGLAQNDEQYGKVLDQFLKDISRREVPSKQA